MTQVLWNASLAPRAAVNWVLCVKGVVHVTPSHTRVTEALWAGFSMGPDPSLPSSNNLVGGNNNGPVDPSRTLLICGYKWKAYTSEPPTPPDDVDFLDLAVPKLVVRAWDIIPAPKDDACRPMFSSTLGILTPHNSGSPYVMADNSGNKMRVKVMFPITSGDPELATGMICTFQASEVDFKMKVGPKTAIGRTKLLLSMSAEVPMIAETPTDPTTLICAAVNSGAKSACLAVVSSAAVLKDSLALRYTDALGYRNGLEDVMNVCRNICSEISDYCSIKRSILSSDPEIEEGNFDDEFILDFPGDNASMACSISTPLEYVHSNGNKGIDTIRAGKIGC